MSITKLATIQIPFKLLKKKDILILPEITQIHETFLGWLVQLLNDSCLANIPTFYCWKLIYAQVYVKHFFPLCYYFNQWEEDRKTLVM